MLVFRLFFFGSRLTEMAIVQGISFVKLYCCEFETVARGHHIYKRVWKPVIGEKLSCKNDRREEAKLYDDFAIVIYKSIHSTGSSQPSEELVGHLPIELSFLLYNFLELDGCSLQFSPTGARFLEDGLVVPGRYSAFSKNKKLVDILYKELELRVEKIRHMKLHVIQP